MIATYGEYRAYQSLRLWYADEDLRDVYIFHGNVCLMQAVCKAMGKDELEEFLKNTVDSFKPKHGENNGDR